MRNENGYALVLVLLIITITFTFAFSMSGMALNSRKQINNTDNLNVATDLAEMGVAHYEGLAREYVKISSNKAKENIAAELASLEFPIKKNQVFPEYDEEFRTVLEKEIEKNTQISSVVENNNSYKIDSINLVRTAHNKFTLSFISEGITDLTTKILDNTIQIEKKDKDSLSGKPVTSSESFTDKVVQPIDFKGNGQDKVLYFPSSTYFNDSISISGNRLIAINGDAFFNDKVDFNGGADIVVYGNAIFRYKYDEPKQPNEAYSFCVTGNTYLITNDKLVPYAPFPEGNNASCPKGSSEGWYIDPDSGVEVEY